MTRKHSRSPDPIKTAIRTEKEILEDVRRRTGIAVSGLPWFDTKKDERVAKAVLPILAEWLEKPIEGIRGTIYSLFASPYAKDWIDLIVANWLTCEDELSRSALVSALCIITQDRDAPRIFELMQRDVAKLEDFRLLAKLAEFPSVERQVRDYMVKVLEEREVGASDLEDASKVRDPRIAEQVRRREHSKVSTVRLVARRFAARSNRLPLGLYRVAEPPSRDYELFSTEVDYEDLKRLLRDLASRFDLRLSSSSIKKVCDVLLGAPLDTWLATEVKDKNGRPGGIWLRLEDIDTVEVIVASVSPSAGETVN